MKVIINGGNPLNGCPKNWDEAKEIQEWLNKDIKDEPVEWSFDCGFKLDFDTPPGFVSILSRFYPPKEHYGETWDGKMEFYFDGSKKWEFDFDEPTLEELKNKVHKIYFRQKAIILSGY